MKNQIKEVEGIQCGKCENPIPNDDIVRIVREMTNWGDDPDEAKLAEGSHEENMKFLKEKNYGQLIDLVLHHYNIRCEVERKLENLKTGDGIIAPKELLKEAHDLIFEKTNFKNECCCYHMSHDRLCHDCKVRSVGGRLEGVYS